MNFSKNSFISYGFDEYISTFQQYHNSNLEDFKSKKSVLCKYLNEESINNVERFLNLILKLPLPSKDFLIRSRSIYNEEEIKQIREEEKYKKEVLSTFYKKYFLEGWEKMEVNVFKYHCGLKYLPKYVIKNLKGTIFIDGGAFWGDSMLILNKYSPEKIICFEPNSVNFLKLKEVISKNNLFNVAFPIKEGLSYKAENLTMNSISFKQNHGASVVFSPAKAKQEVIPLNSLDEHLYNSSNNIGLIKLDVEGYGLQAIKGAKNIIKKNLPVISCAIYHNPEEFFDILPLLQSYSNKYKFIVKPLYQGFILKEMTLLAWV